MAGHSTPTSFAQQVQDMSHTSSDNEEDNSPRSVRPLSVCLPGATSSRPSQPRKTGTNPTAAEEHHQNHLTTSKKPRGRPRGSKNKPKPPVIITRDSDSAMRPAILKISAGSDVVDMVAEYARRRNVGLTILGGSGSVSNITLRSSSSSPVALSLHGPLNILSLSGTYLSTTTSPASSLGITLAGTNGNVYGGIIGGSVMAASDVKVVVATFKDPTFHYLPGDFEESNEDSSPKSAAAAAGGAGETTTAAMSLYNRLPVAAAAPAPLNCHMSPASARQDVLSWGPASSSRQPPY